MSNTEPEGRQNRPVEATVGPCRRCSVCEGMTHHWMDNEDCSGPDDPSHVCKHCDAVGDFCDECDGAGCAHCNGDGVLLMTPNDVAQPTARPEVPHE